MNIQNALAIDGYMADAELEWLAQHAKDHKVIAEIGSFLGRSTRALADNTRGVVYAIDDWHGPREERVRMTPAVREKLFEQFCRNMAGLEGRVLVVRADHGDTTSLDIPYRPDFVFIDGSHEYEDVLRDIKFWYRKAAPGALLSGHDYPFFPGVKRAVDEVFKGDIKVSGSIWFHEKNYPFYSAKGN